MYKLNNYTIRLEYTELDNEINNYLIVLYG